MSNIAKAIPFEEQTTFSNFINTMWDYTNRDGHTFDFDVIIDKYNVEDKEVDCVLYTYTKKTKRTTKKCNVRFFDDIEHHVHSPRYYKYTYTYDLVLSSNDITKETSRFMFASLYKQSIEDILKYPNWNIGEEFDKLASSNKDVEVRFSNIKESLNVAGTITLTAEYCIVFVDRNKDSE